MRIQYVSTNNFQCFNIAFYVLSLRVIMVKTLAVESAPIKSSLHAGHLAH